MYDRSSMSLLVIWFILVFMPTPYAFNWGTSVCVRYIIKRQIIRTWRVLRYIPSTVIVVFDCWVFLYPFVRASSYVCSTPMGYAYHLVHLPELRDTSIGIYAHSTIILFWPLCWTPIFHTMSKLEEGDLERLVVK
jgi:hypothetical protein